MKLLLDRVTVTFFSYGIMLYQLIVSPVKSTPSCRFLPTCSNYMMQALEKHGTIKGGVLGVKRLCRCHPWGKHGIDEVP
jgi:uncharacterized protein